MTGGARKAGGGGCGMAAEEKTRAGRRGVKEQDCDLVGLYECSVFT